MICPRELKVGWAPPGRGLLVERLRSHPVIKCTMTWGLIFQLSQHLTLISLKKWEWINRSSLWAAHIFLCMYVYDLKHSVSISVLLYVEYYSDPWISSPVVSVKRLLGLMGRSLHLIPWFICTCTHGYRHSCTPTGAKLLFCENDILNKGNALKFLYFILFWLQRRQGGSILSSLSRI